MSIKGNLVSFLIIARNASGTLGTLLKNLEAQTYPAKQIEIILVDSASQDDTKQIMMQFQTAHRNEFYDILVLDNPKMILPCGWNVALREAHGDVILRVDAHSTLPPDFIACNMANFANGEKIVGGPRTSVVAQDNAWQRTLLTAEESLFGSGIAAYRHCEDTRYVSTLAHGAYAREVFETVGGYDERLARTEDNEMHYRMKQAGYRLFFDSKIHSYHHPRNRFSKMLKQKYLNGYWIGLTLRICPRCFSPYHFVPLLFVLAILGGLVLGLCGIWWPLAALGIAYGAVDLLLTVASVLRKPFSAYYFCLPVLFLLLHLAYGWGTLTGIVKIPFWYPKNKHCDAIEQVKDAMKRHHE